MKSIVSQIAKLSFGLLMSSVAGVGNAEYDLLSHGANVVAEGHNPDWSLNVQDKTNTLSFTTAGLGTLNYTYPSMSPTRISEVNTTVIMVPNNSHVMNIAVQDVACTDNVRRKAHEVRVIVRVDGNDYVGCGDVAGH